MKYIHFLSTLVFILANAILGHSQYTNERHIISAKIGVGLDDGLVYSYSPPTLGFGYEYRIFRFFGIGTDVIFFYRSFGDSHTLFSNIIQDNENTLLISKEEIDVVLSKGIKRIESIKTIKYLQIPLSLFLSAYPINNVNHSLSISVGVTGTYGSYKHPRDQFTVNITLNDGTLFENVRISPETEFRNFVFGASLLKLEYVYKLKRDWFGLSVSNYDYLWTLDGTVGFWNFSLNYLINLQK